MNKFEVPSVFAFVKNSIHRSAINTSNNIWEFCKHEIMQKRYRIPGEIFTCIVNDPCLLCFTCRKVRCAFGLTLRLEFVDTENLAVYLRVIFYVTPLGNHGRVEGNFLRAVPQFYFLIDVNSPFYEN